VDVPENNCKTCEPPNSPRCPESNLVTSHKVIGRAATDYDPVRDSISAVSVS
jgi:hypothetical protein